MYIYIYAPFVNQCLYGQPWKNASRGIKTRVGWWVSDFITGAKLILPTTMLEALALSVAWEGLTSDSFRTSAPPFTSICFLSEEPRCNNPDFAVDKKMNPIAALALAKCLAMMQNIGGAVLKAIRVRAGTLCCLVMLAKALLFVASLPAAMSSIGLSVQRIIFVAGGFNVDLSLFSFHAKQVHYQSCFFLSKAICFGRGIVLIQTIWADT